MKAMNESASPFQRTRNYRRRQWREKVLKYIFGLSTIFGCLFLVVLLASILNNAFGLVMVEDEVSIHSIAPAATKPEDISREELARILTENLTRGMLRKIAGEGALSERTDENLRDLVVRFVLKPRIIESWSFTESLFERRAVDALLKAHPTARVYFRSWISPELIANEQSSKPEEAGVRTAILGSLWTVAIALLFAFPVGVGAAIYLNELAPDNMLTRFINLNIYNLAGVPSIIYGLLGLAIFVRLLEPLTSGAIFGASGETTANGRTILSAGLTMGLLILPIIIITTREALRAVPESLRHSVLALGATKWQMIWHHMLPASMDRILTGTILAVSRAIGETAPLVVIGASTYIALDPSGIFSKFTALPIQIYQWSARPQEEYRHLAAGAIIVLLVLLLSLNAFAIVLRDRLSRKKRGN